MRNLTILVVTALLSGIGYLIYQEYQMHMMDTPTTAVVVIDITDDDILLPTADHIIEQAGLKDNLYGEIFVEFVFATDEEIAPVRELHLKRVFPLLADERLRKKEIYEFTQEIVRILEEIESMDRELSYSAIYAQINKAMQRLIDRKGVRIVIIASNGYEHTEKYSVYQSKRLQKHKFAPEVYAKGLEKIEPPVAIADVEIVFFMNPHNRQESVFQTNVVDGYRLLYPDASITIETL